MAHLSDSIGMVPSLQCIYLYLVFRSRKIVVVSSMLTNQYLSKYLVKMLKWLCLQTMAAQNTYLHSTLWLTAHFCRIYVLRVLGHDDRFSVSEQIARSLQNIGTKLLQLQQNTQQLGRKNVNNSPTVFHLP